MSRKQFIKTWLPHESSRRRVRNLRQWTRPIIDSKDPAYIAAGLRVIKACKEEPDMEYATLHLYHAAMKMSAETKQPWPVCMDFLMDEFDKRKDADGEEIPSLTHDGKQITRQERPEVPTKGPSLISRLLRKVVARSRLQSDAADSKRDEHQQPRDGDGQRSSSERRHPAQAHHRRTDESV